MRKWQGMHANYRFRMEPLFAGEDPHFRLAVGMAGEQDAELIPASQSAFAHQLPLEEYHVDPVEVQIELTCLLEWLSNRLRAEADTSGSDEGRC